MPLEFVTAAEASKFPEGAYVLCATACSYGMKYEVAQQGRNLDWHLDHAQRFARLPDAIDGLPFPRKRSWVEIREELRAAGGDAWDSVPDVDRGLRRIRGTETYAEQFEGMTREELLKVKADLDAAMGRVPAEPTPPS